MNIIPIKRKNEYRNEIPALLTDDMTISGDAKILWVKLYNSNRGKNKTYNIWKPTTQSLATQFGVDKRTIKRWLKELKDNGWIHTIGDKIDTTMFVYFTPIVVTKMSPEVVTEMSPYTKHNALATKVGESALLTTTTNLEDLEEDFNKFFDND
jgi:hypothetical protein